MITQVIKQLQSENWYNVSGDVEIAKGKYKRVTTFRQFFKQLGRVLKGNKIYK